MIYSITTTDRCAKSDVLKICNGASDLMMRGYRETSTTIFKALESKKLIKCEW